MHHLLVEIDFASDFPHRQQVTAKAIVERRGEDACCWLLDTLQDIAADPTANVPAVLAHRLKNGALDGEIKPTTKASRPARPPLHDAGEAIRHENDCRRREEQEADPERWVRNVVRCRVLTERAAPATVAAELGVPVEQVEAIVAELQAAVSRSSARERTKDAKRQSLALVPQWTDSSSDEGCRADRMAALYREQGRRPSSHVLEAIR